MPVADQETICAPGGRASFRQSSWHRIAVYPHDRLAQSSMEWIQRTWITQGRDNSVFDVVDDTARGSTRAPAEPRRRFWHGAWGLRDSRDTRYVLYIWDHLVRAGASALAAMSDSPSGCASNF